MQIHTKYNAYNGLCCHCNQVSLCISANGLIDTSLRQSYSIYFFQLIMWKWREWDRGSSQQATTKDDNKQQGAALSSQLC